MRVALIQMTSSLDVQANLEKCRALANRARQTGATWILFPENAPFLGRDEEKLPFAETIKGAMVRFFADLAIDLDAWITVGSFPEKSPDPDRTYNTQVHLGRDGEVVDFYRKIHLFDVAVSEEVTFCESDSVYPGEEVVDTHIVDELGQKHCVGMTICYDLRFPEIYRVLQRRGAEILTVPSAFTLPTGRAHWHALLRARAIENQAYVLAPNQWGHHYGKRHSFGNSAIYDPWGQCIATSSDREGFIVADLDFEYLREIRRSMPVLAHRRVDESRR